MMAKIGKEDTTQSSNMGIAIVAKETTYYFAKKAFFKPSTCVRLTVYPQMVKDAESAQETRMVSNTSNH